METGQSYHIYKLANGSENLFREEENYRFFLQQFQKHLLGVVDPYAYCLMPNHFHFLIQIKTGSNEKLASQAFSNLFNSYVKAFNKQQNKSGMNG
jgi:REP element-mobilizing transposase RayT